MLHRWRNRLSGPSARATGIKLKINGLCVNSCAFCPFHSDPSRLEVDDLRLFFDNLQTNPARTIAVNGGEPTIHPDFLAICDYLREEFGSIRRLVLGTNIIPFSYRSDRYRAVFQSAIETFDVLQVGCDDEHRNIDTVEQLAPVFIDAGLRLRINVITQFCSQDTKRRILAVRDRWSATVTFSPLAHDYRSLPRIHRLTAPCLDRLRWLTIHCDGNVFFCNQQEFEQPIFNLHTVAPERIDDFVNRHDPGPFYRFCECCHQYLPDRGPTSRALTRLSNVADRLVTSWKASRALAAPGRRIRHQRHLRHQG
jgi:hypothetical protein